jgi:ArsR family metal-binding transcriptional regulator
VDALALLKKDHDEVKKLLKDLDDTTDRAIKTRQHLFERLEHDVVDPILGSSSRPRSTTRPGTPS